MSGADHRRPTLRLDRERLEALARDAAEEPAETPAEQPALGRTNTLEDPLTTQLLAEVARRTKTVDFDSIDLDDEANNLGSAETPHPHTTKRTRTR